MQRKGMLRQWFLPYFKKHRGVVAVDLLCAALTTLNEIVLPMLCGRSRPWRWTTFRV